MVSERRQISGEISAMEQERAGLHTSLNEQRPGRPDDARRSLSSALTRIKCPSLQQPARPSQVWSRFLPACSRLSLEPKRKALAVWMSKRSAAALWCLLKVADFADFDN